MCSWIRAPSCSIARVGSREASVQRIVGLRFHLVTCYLPTYLPTCLPTKPYLQFDGQSLTRQQGSHHRSPRSAHFRSRCTNGLPTSTTGGLRGDTVPARASRSHRIASRPSAEAARTGWRTGRAARRQCPSRSPETRRAAHQSGCVAPRMAL